MNEEQIENSTSVSATEPQEVLLAEHNISSPRESKDDRQVLREKRVIQISVSIFAFLSFLALWGLIFVTKNYLVWAADVHKAQNDLQQIRTAVESQRGTLEDELQRLKVQRGELL